MVMNMQHLPQKNLKKKCFSSSKSCINMVEFNSKNNDHGRASPLQDETKEENGEPEVRGWLAVCTHFCYGVPCLY